MSRICARIVIGAVVALLASGTVGFARASLAAADDLASGALPASAAPQLLGPVDALGRNGWTCVPERAAAARTAREAELPEDDRH